MKQCRPARKIPHKKSRPHLVDGINKTAKRKWAQPPEPPCRTAWRQPVLNRCAHNKCFLTRAALYSVAHDHMGTSKYDIAARTLARKLLSVPWRPSRQSRPFLWSPPRTPRWMEGFLARSQARKPRPRRKRLPFLPQAATTWWTMGGVSTRDGITRRCSFAP